MTNEELCTCYQNGEAEALEKLYNKNRGLIETIIKKYAALQDPDDLRQESFFAVMQAAALWDHSKGGNFATYCAYWIKQAVHRYVLANYGTIRAPEHLRGRIRRYNRVLNAYRLQFGRDPSDIELAAVLELSPQQLDNLKRDIVTLHTRSASEPVGEDGETELEEFIKDPKDPIEEALDRIQTEELHQAIEEELEKLPEREAEIIRKRHYEGATLKETAAALGVSPERVRQLEARAFRSLRKPAAARRLMTYFTDGGAYSAGLHNTGLSTFRRSWTSSQEAAIIRLEQDAARIRGQIRAMGIKTSYDDKKVFNGVPIVE